MSVIGDIFGLLGNLVALAALGLALAWTFGAVEVRKCWHVERGAFYILSRRTYVALIDHRRHPALFSERQGRARFSTLRAGRWCLHYGKPVGSAA